MTTIVRAIGGGACPSQWDAWDSSGQYWYLRYRGGTGTAETQPTDDMDTWTWKSPEIMFRHGHPLNGSITLEEFARLAGLTLDIPDEAHDKQE